MTKDPGGQAFPRQDVSLENCNRLHKTNVKGMTLRDYFAGQVLVGFLSQSPSSWFSSFKSATEAAVEMAEKDYKTTEEETFAKQAYEVADAMIAERNK